MNSLDERLPTELSRLADAAELSFTLDDVVQAGSKPEFIDLAGADSVPDADVRSARVATVRRLVAAAAGVAVIAGGFALYQSPTRADLNATADSSDLHITVPQSSPSSIGNGVTATVEGTPDSIAEFVPFGRELLLVPSDDPPTLLGPDAVVLDAEQIGRIEIDNRSPLEMPRANPTDSDTPDTICIAQTELGYTTIQLTFCHDGPAASGHSIRFIGGSAFSQTYRDHGVYDERVLFTVISHDRETGLILIGNVPAEVAFLEIASLLPYFQVPQNGVAALPFTPSGRDASDVEIKIKGYDSGGTLNLVLVLGYEHTPVIIDADEGDRDSLEPSTSEVSS